MTNSLPQYTHSKRSRADEWDYRDMEVPHPCELVPFDLLVRWNALDTTTPILSGEQHLPMATYIAAPTMREAVAHVLSVSNALAAIRP